MALLAAVLCSGCGQADRGSMSAPRSASTPESARPPHDQETALREPAAAEPPQLMPVPLSPQGEDPQSLIRPIPPEAALEPFRSALAPPQAAPEGGLSPGAPATRAKPYDVVRVFYGTDRRQTGSRVPKEYFGTHPGETSFGFCDVSIPRGHKTGRLESPSIWRFEFREDPKKHVVLLNVTPRPRDTFMSELRQRVWNSMEIVESADGPLLVGGEAFVFVHGFNNSFEDAARRTAQIAHDLMFRGAPIMFSWPSQSRATLEGYKEDGNMAGWSEEHLIEFVVQVAEESGARKVHLIAHSMGNRIVAGALRRLVDQRVAGRVPRFNEVILTAPDIDAEYFKTAIAPRIVSSADRITIYSSSRDLALKVSSLVNPLSRRRLGESGRELTVFPGYDSIEVVDATDVQTDLFSFYHSYHADSPTVLGDIGLVLAGYTAEQRGLSSIVNRLAWKLRSAGHQLTEHIRITPE
jgi:esterase/lipase superfamily enzyme